MSIGPEDDAGPMAGAPLSVTNASGRACRVSALVDVTLLANDDSAGPRVEFARDPLSDVALHPGEKREWYLYFAHRGGSDGSVEGANFPRARVTLPGGGTLGTVGVLCGGLHVSTDVDPPVLDEKPVPTDSPPTTAPDLTGC